MDQGTLLSQVVKSIAHLKEGQESQQKALEELTQQMNSLASSYDSITRSQCRPRENSPDGSVNCNGCIHICTPHLEFPKFNGKDPRGWIYKAQQFFLYYQTPPQDQLLISSIYMEGRALAWYMWMDNSGALTSWEAFTKALEIRFGPSPFYDPVEALIKLTQTATVEDFQSHFEFIANRTKGLPEPFMIGCFINGLREDIRLAVKMFKPTTLSSAFVLARMQEEKYLAEAKSIRIEANTTNPAVSR